jgi:hypothetical protein
MGATVSALASPAPRVMVVGRYRLGARFARASYYSDFFAANAMQKAKKSQ